MSLTARQVELVQQSFADVGEAHAPYSTQFYDNLFARAPELRYMFRDDIKGQGMKFMSTLGTIVSALNDPAVLVEELRYLGEGHGALGVKAEHFEPMGEALMDTFREVLGEAFTEETEAAWRAAYATISRRMILRGRID